MAEVLGVSWVCTVKKSRLLSDKRVDIKFCWSLQSNGSFDQFQKYEEKNGDEPQNS